MAEQIPENERAPVEEPTPRTEPTPDQRNLAVFAHLLGIVTWFVGALVVWIVSRHSAYVTDQAREALNFQITVGLAYAAVGLLTCATLGVTSWLPGVVWLVNIVFCIVAAIQASRSKLYRYPIALRLIS